MKKNAYNADEIEQLVAPGVSLDRAPSLQVEVAPEGSGMTMYAPPRPKKTAAPALGEAKKRRQGAVRAIYVDPSKTALGRTIRLHEMLHANHSRPAAAIAEKYNVREETAQTIEDCFVQMMYWPKNLPRASWRDALSVALSDLRGMTKDKQFVKAVADKASDPTAYNQALCAAMRCAAIWHKTANASRSKRTKDVKKISAAINGLFGCKMSGAYKEVIRLIYSNKRKAALRLFDSLFRNPPGSGEGEGTSPNPQEQVEHFQLAKGSGEDVSAMQVNKLALTEPTQVDEPSWSNSRAGSRINVGRLPGVMATGDTLGLFTRDLDRRPSGAVLIDNSGSMNMSQSELVKLCRLAPSATVAYYWGIDGNHELLRERAGLLPHQNGRLVIFAREGLRASHTWEENHPEYSYCAGNDVDFEALQWLLQQPGPLFFITDMCFCGGTANQADMAKALLWANLDRVKVIGGYQEAIEMFGALKME